MYDEYYNDYLDELLEEAYLEGYYDSIDDYDDYYMERRSTIHPAYDLDLFNPNVDVWDSKLHPYEDKIFNKLKDKYKDKDTLDKYLKAYKKLSDNKIDAYNDRRDKDRKYLRNKGVDNKGVDYVHTTVKQRHRRPVDMDEYNAKAEKGKANLEKKQERLEKERLHQEKLQRKHLKQKQLEKERLMAARRKKIGIGVGVGAGAAVLGGAGYGLYKYNKKKKAMLDALKDPKFRDEHPELVKKYRKELIKEGIKLESAYCNESSILKDKDSIAVSGSLRRLGFYDQTDAAKKI